MVIKCWESLRMWSDSTHWQNSEGRLLSSPLPLFQFFFSRVDGSLHPSLPTSFLHFIIQCIKEWKFCSLSLALICFLLSVSLQPLFFSSISLCFVSFSTASLILCISFLAMSYLQFVIETQGTIVLFLSQGISSYIPGAVLTISLPG